MINSWIAAGLSSCGVTEAADLVLRWDILREIGRVGPGLSSISPDSSIKKEIRRQDCGRDWRQHETIDRLVRKLTGNESRDLQMEEKGKGW